MPGERRTRRLGHSGFLHGGQHRQQVRIIGEHFHDNVVGLLDGYAKAMVVTDCRKAAAGSSAQARRLRSVSPFSRSGFWLEHSPEEQRARQDECFDFYCAKRA